MKLQHVVLATNNAKKLRELRRVLDSHNLNVQVFGLSDFAPYPAPEETELTFEANALLKASAAARQLDLPALADDSGLSVAELGGMPGVRSARWAGPDASDQDNLELLLQQMEQVPGRRRSATFTCALALAGISEGPRVWIGEMPGELATEPAGEGGFGYDPIFIPAGYSHTAAELSPEDKDSISHRGQALRQFAAWLQED